MSSRTLSRAELRKLKKKESKGSLQQKNQTPSKSVAIEVPVCDAILVAESNVAGEKEMRRDAKSSLGDALETGGLYVEKVGGGIHVGNLRGLEYAREAERQVREIPCKKDWVFWRNG